MLGAKTGWKAGKGGVKGFFAGLGLGIAGAVAHLVATALAPVAGAIMGAAGGARAGWNKTMRGAKGNFALGGLIAAIGGGIGGAVAGAGLGLAATTIGAGPQAVDPAMVDEVFGTTETTEVMKAKKITQREVKRGDIILVHGGDDMGTGFIKFGQSFHQLWSGKSRKASTGFRHAGVAISSGMYAHVTGEGAA